MYPALSDFMAAVNESGPLFSVVIAFLFGTELVRFGFRVLTGRL